MCSVFELVLNRSHVPPFYKFIITCDLKKQKKSRAFETNRNLFFFSNSEQRLQFKMASEHTRLEIVNESPKESHRLNRAVDSNSLEMVFGKPNDPKTDATPGVHFINNERRNDRHPVSFFNFLFYLLMSDYNFLLIIQFAYC